MKKRLLTLAMIACLGWVDTGIAVNTSFLNDSAVAEFRDDDMTMLLATIEQVLALPEGETRTWDNPATGAHGSVKALGSHTIDGRECRKLLVENHARGRTGKGQWPYCRGGDGRWELKGR